MHLRGPGYTSIFFIFVFFNTARCAKEGREMQVNCLFLVFFITARCAKEGREMQVNCSFVFEFQTRDSVNN